MFNWMIGVCDWNRGGIGKVCLDVSGGGIGLGWCTSLLKWLMQMVHMGVLHCKVFEYLGSIPVWCRLLLLLCALWWIR